MLTNAIAPDQLGGLERYVRELASCLATKGVDVGIVAKRSNLAPPHERSADGVEIRRYGLPRRAHPLFAVSVPVRASAAVIAATRSVPGAVLHAHFPIPALALAVRRKPYLYTFHAPVYRELLSERGDSYLLPRPIQAPAVRVLREAERLVVRRATRIVVLSEFMRSELARLDVDAAARAVLLAGGVDTRRFSPGVGKRDSWGAEAQPLIFTARRLTPRTGVEQLLRAMPLIRAAMPRARLEVAGSGRQEGALRDEARRLDLDDAVRFLGVISDDELVNRYRACDLVVLPTQELEGFGLTTAEALASGAVVVGTPVGATPELLARVDPSLLAAGRDAPAIADAVVSLCAAPERIDRVRQRLATSDLGVGWDAVVKRYLEEYSLVAEASRARFRVIRR